ncbi:hypothetical protein H4S07_000353 [Coemansia furcata]|uniref:Uncharacterized protein n=1 Tax=Coemansia furcata TaxID=417177 RepID=A0ACC1LQF6_9FUNG|nr:hypothetical protein H4S07_000353 [Coemansia furcata]
MAPTSFASSNTESSGPNVAQAKLPKLLPEFIAQHYPSEAKLLHVHLVHRHGERTPVTHLFPSISPKYWNFCVQGNRLHSDFTKAVGVYAPNSDVDSDVDADKKGKDHQKWHNYMFKSENSKKRGIFPDDPSKAHSNDKSQFTADTCAYGQLTDVGRQSLTALGAHMRALYTDALGFLPAIPRPGDDNGPTEDLYLRTTSYTRAFESLQHTLGGMYPNLPVNSRIFRINVRPRNIENLYSDYRCKVLDRLHTECSKESVEHFSEDHAKLHRDILQIPSLGEPFEVELKRRAPFASLFVWDTTSSMRSHGLPLPKEIDDDFISRVSHMCAVEYQRPAMRSTQLARMQIGPFVRELTDNVVSVVEADRGIIVNKQRPPKMSIYSGHDTTIGPLLAIFGDDLAGSPSLTTSATPLWPPFSSSLRIELLKDSASPYPDVQPSWAGDLANHSEDLSTIPPEERIRPFNVPDSLYRLAPGQTDNTLATPFNPRAMRDYYVRIWYNDRTVQLPACRDPGAHHTKLGSSVCTLDGFFKQVARFVPSESETIQELHALAKAQSKSQ